MCDHLSLVCYLLNSESPHNDEASDYTCIRICMSYYIRIFFTAEIGPVLEQLAAEYVSTKDNHSLNLSSSERFTFVPLDPS